LQEETEVNVADSNGLRVKTGGWKNLLDEKVKMVAVTGQSNVLGTIVNIEEVVKRVKKHAPEALVLVDGAQMVPHMKVDVKDLGIDFLVFSGHKMLGPTGVGVFSRRPIRAEAHI